MIRGKTMDNPKTKPEELRCLGSALNDLLSDNKIELDDSLKVPDNEPVSCESVSCGWKGILSDCETEMDSEGWEYPEYEVLVCPNCGEYSVTF